MNLQTIRKLNELNQSFYASISESFDQTRNKNWQGWEQMLEYFTQQNWRPRSVCDIACGNGRLYDFLDANIDGIDYTGVDFNHQLLSIAQTKYSSKSNCKFINLDILNEEMELDMQFDLVCGFGIMHHIAGELQRKELIQRLLNLTNNYLVITFWQFATQERYQGRFIDPTKAGIERTELESNDFILDWQRGDNQATYRYCHHYDQQELNSLAEDLNLKIEATYFADGRDNNLNLYWIIRK